MAADEHQLQVAEQVVRRKGQQVNPAVVAASQYREVDVPELRLGKKVLLLGPPTEPRYAGTADALTEEGWRVEYSGDLADGPCFGKALVRAEAGEFAKAVETAERVLQMAVAAGDTEVTADIRKRLDLYKAGKPYRVP